MIRFFSRIDKSEYIHEVDSRLGGTEIVVVSLAEATAAARAVVTVVAGVDPSHAKLGLDVEVTAHKPRVAVGHAKSGIPALIAMIAHGPEVGAKQLEVKVDIAHIVLSAKGSLNFLGTNLKNLKDHRYQGWYGGLGVAYGYSWILSRHFNIEAELGVGWIYTKFDTFECAGCGRRINSERSHNYVGPTKAAINLVYVF